MTDRLEPNMDNVASPFTSEGLKRTYALRDIYTVMPERNTVFGRIGPEPYGIGTIETFDDEPRVDVVDPHEQRSATIANTIRESIRATYDDVYQRTSEMFNNAFTLATDIYGTDKLYFEVTFLAINEDLDPIIDGHIGQVDSYSLCISKGDIEDALLPSKLSRCEESFYKTMYNMTKDLIGNALIPKFKITIDCKDKEVRDFEFEMRDGDLINHKLHAWAKEIRMNVNFMVINHLIRG